MSISRFVDSKVEGSNSVFLIWLETPFLHIVELLIFARFLLLLLLNMNSYLKS